MVMTEKHIRDQEVWVVPKVTEVRHGNRDVATRKELVINIFTFLLILLLRFFFFSNSKIKLASWVWKGFFNLFLWRAYYEKNLSASPSLSSGELEVPSQKGQPRLVDCIISSLLYWLRLAVAGAFTFLCLWKKNQSCFTEEDLVITSHCQTSTVRVVLSHYWISETPKPFMRAPQNQMPDRSDWQTQ